MIKKMISERLFEIYSNGTEDTVRDMLKSILELRLKRRAIYRMAVAGVAVLEEHDLQKVLSVINSHKYNSQQIYTEEDFK